MRIFAHNALVYQTLFDDDLVWRNEANSRFGQLVAFSRILLKALLIRQHNYSPPVNRCPNELMQTKLFNEQVEKIAPKKSSTEQLTAMRRQQKNRCEPSTLELNFQRSTKRNQFMRVVLSLPYAISIKRHILVAFRQLSAYKKMIFSPELAAHLPHYKNVIR